MKTNNILLTNGAYEAPVVTRLDIAVEKGFAVSGGSKGRVPGVDEDWYDEY